MTQIRRANLIKPLPGAATVSIRVNAVSCGYDRVGNGRAMNDVSAAPPRAPAALWWVSALGPFAYIVLTTALGVMWEGYDHIRDTQSELGAVDSPYRHVMNFGGFAGLGVVILAFAGGYWWGLRRGVAHLVATGLLVVAGVGMVTVAFFPCDAGCVDVTTTGRLHGMFSAPGAIGLPGAAMISASVFRADGRLGFRWQPVSFWLGLLTLASGPVTAAEFVEGVNGLLQRVAMWTPLLWMSAVSARLMND